MKGEVGDIQVRIGLGVTRALEVVGRENTAVMAGTAQQHIKKQKHVKQESEHRQVIYDT